MNWKSNETLGQEIVGAAVNSNFFPLYEVEKGITTITHDPEAKKKKIEVKDWLKHMGKTKHMLTEENSELGKEFEKEVDRRWNQLKAKHESPYL